MRLAVLSDIHGNLEALNAVLDDMESLDAVDLTWCLGDLAAFGARPNECIEKIQQLAQEDEGKTFKVIGGNTDRYLVNGTRFPMPSAKDEESFKHLASNWQTRDTLLNWNVSQLSWNSYTYLKEILYRELSVEVENFGHIIGYHAVPGNDEAMLLPDISEEGALDFMLDREGRVGIGGHTHIQMDRDLGKWRLINPGSVGLSVKNAGFAEYAILTFTDDTLQVDLRQVPYSVDAVLQDMDEVGYPTKDWALARLTPPE